MMVWGRLREDLQSFRCGCLHFFHTQAWAPVQYPSLEREILFTKKQVARSCFGRGLDGNYDLSSVLRTWYPVLPAASMDTMINISVKYFVSCFAQVSMETMINIIALRARLVIKGEQSNG